MPTYSAPDKLEQWARILRIPGRLLWFHVVPDANDSVESPVVPSTLAATTPVNGNDDMQFLRATGAAVTLGAVGSGALTGANGQSTLIAEVRQMIAAFRASDNRYGGSHSRTSLAAYFNRTVKPQLSGRASTGLFAAAAEMQHLAGWMAYDIGHPELGRYHLRKAVRLCRRAEDVPLAAETFAGMSHQAAFQGAADTAVDFALAAEQAAASVDLPCSPLRSTFWPHTDTP